MSALNLELPDEFVEAIAQTVLERLTATIDADPWLTADQAADYMACKPQRIYDLRSQGRLAAGRDGSRLLFRRSTLDIYLEQAS